GLASYMLSYHRFPPPTLPLSHRPSVPYSAIPNPLPLQNPLLIGHFLWARTRDKTHLTTNRSIGIQRPDPPPRCVCLENETESITAVQVTFWERKNGRIGARRFFLTVFFLWRVHTRALDG